MTILLSLLAALLASLAFFLLARRHVQPLPACVFIPIVGYFWARRHQDLPILLPIMQLLFILLGVRLSLLATPLHASLVLFLLATLLLLSLDDAATMTIYDGDLIILALVAALDTLLFGHLGFVLRLLGAVLVTLPLLLIYLYKRDALGSGDILLMAVMGFYLGPMAVAYAFLLSTSLALAWSLILLASKRATATTAIPLVPFLSLGCAVMMLC